MTLFVWGLVVGLVLGANVGVLVAALCRAAARPDEVGENAPARSCACGDAAVEGSDFCWRHHPDREQERLAIDAVALALRCPACGTVRPSSQAGCCWRCGVAVPEIKCAEGG